MTLCSTFTWKMHLSSTNTSYPVKSTPVTTIVSWLCSGLSKNWSGVSLSKKRMYKIAAQWVMSERKSKSFTFLIHMEIFHENFLVLLARHGIKKWKSLMAWKVSKYVVISGLNTGNNDVFGHFSRSAFFYTFETIFGRKVFILTKMTRAFWSAKC